MQVVLPDYETRASIEVCGGDVNGERPLSDEEFFDFCMKNPDLHIERRSNGEIVIMPPAGMETGYRNSDVSVQLGNWTKKDGRGVAFDSSAEFILPSGAAFAPDASWVLKSRLTSLTKAEKELFGRLCPDFVIELKSPRDRAQVSERPAACIEGQDGRVDREWRPVRLADRRRSAHGLRVSPRKAGRRTA